MDADPVGYEATHRASAATPHGASVPDRRRPARAGDAPPEPAPPGGPPEPGSERLYRAVSRSADVVLAAAGLTLCMPVMLVIALAIRLDSPGPALYLHQRIGFNRRRGERRAGSDGGATGPERRTGDGRRIERRFGRPFYLYKFRTMYVDAPQRFPELYAYQYEEHELETVPIKVLVGSERRKSNGGSEPELGSDPRVTRVGRVLRRTSLDELPNFINVLRGDMSLVGPRPDISENIRWYRPQHLRKLDVKPGVTGLAQVEGRGYLPLHQTNELDVEYVTRQSMWLDVKIILRTIWVIIRRHGAY